MPPRASWTCEKAPKKLGVSAWEVQIAPKNPRIARKKPPGTPWKPPRAPGTPQEGFHVGRTSLRLPARFRSDTADLA